MKKNKKIIVIGAGISGITLTERLAKTSSNVLIIDKRNHIGGNCYDFKDKNGFLVHKYGPHIFHTNHKDVWEYLSKFTSWIPYEHRVLGFIDKKYVPIPFNLKTLKELLPKKLSEKLEKKLKEKFGFRNKISILDLKKYKDKDLKFLADFIYKKVFFNYTKKQWGKRPEEIDKKITSRVPVIISFDDRYFHDKYQGMPKDGFTKMFEKMLKNKNIKIKLNTNYQKIKNKTNFDLMFYTGPIDEFFNYKYGNLKYRYFNFNIKTIDKESYLPSAVVNYPNNYKFTRITEFKKFYPKTKNKKTVIGYEYPGNKGYLGWPFLDKENLRKLKKYQGEVKRLKNVYFVGRLGEFKYYDMDDAVKNALDLFKKIYERNK